MGVKKTSKISILIAFVLLMLPFATALSTVTINNPSSSSIVSGVITLNATTDAAAENMTFEWINSTGQIENTTSNVVAGTEFTKSFDTQALSDGVFTFNATAQNSTGTVITNQSTSVTVDNNVPIVSNIRMTASYNVTRSDSNFDINATVTDATTNIVSVNASNSGIVALSDIGGDTWQATTTAATLGCNTDGSCTITITAEDQAGNTNNTEQFTFTVDDTNPAVSSVAVNTSFLQSTDGIQVNVTASDTNIDSVTVNGVSMNNIGGNNYQVDTTPSALSCSANGNCTLTVNATDQAGNYNDTTTIQITIDDNAPTITLNYPSVGQNITSSSVNFNWTATDAVDTSLSCDLNVDGNVNSSITSLNGTKTNFTITGLSEGSHSWNVTCQDDIPNSQTSTTQSFTIDATSPSVSNLQINRTSIAKDEAGENIHINVSATDATSSVATATASGGSDVAMSDAGGNIWEATTTASALGCPVSGECTITITVTDSAGNSDNSQQTTLLITGGVEGTSSSVQGNKANVNVTVNGSTNLGQTFTGTVLVNITSDNEPTLEFNFDFSSDSLNLSQLNITETTISGSNSITIQGLNLSRSGTQKTVYMDQTDTSLNGVCIKDAAGATASSISEDCSGSNEVELQCTSSGQSTGQYTCTDLGSRLKIEGLDHSAILQTDVATTTTTTSSGGGGGGGGRMFNTGRINLAKMDSMVNRSLTINVPGTKIKKIIINPSRTLYNKYVEVINATSHPEFPGQKITSFLLNHNFQEGEIGSAWLQVTLTKEQLGGLSPEEISIYRYDEEELEWLQLETTYNTIIGFDFTAKTPKFSFFIAGIKDESQQSIPEQTTQESQETNEEATQTPSQAEGERAVQERQTDETTEETTPQAESESSSSWPIYLLVIGLALLIVLGMIFYSKEK